MSNIVERLNENIIADAFERKAIADGALCERLIRERKEAADTIKALRAENAQLKDGNLNLQAKAEAIYDDLLEAKGEIVGLRKALKQIHDAVDFPEDTLRRKIRAARAAIGESE